MKFFRRIFSWMQGKQKNKLPGGWTETKISKNTYITHIPQEQIDKWATDRHKRDKINSLVTQDGFHIKSFGRSGTIYYAEKGMLCEIGFEVSGVKHYDILTYFDSLEEWILPNREAMTPDEKSYIKEKLKLWLDLEKIKAEL